MDELELATARDAGTPSEAMLALGRLVGTWRLGEETEGTIHYEWLPGRHFLLQHVELRQAGEVHRGLEVIGHLHPFGGERSKEVRSRYYGQDGSTLDYVYELIADELTIWAGERDSPAFYRGSLKDDDTRLVGGWTYPGGGYRSTAERVH